MEWSDIASIVFGAALGLAISIWRDWLGAIRERKRAKKLLQLVLPDIQMAVAALSGKQIMPTTELPVLSELGVSDLIALPARLGAPVRQLQQALSRAEISRRIASEFIGNQKSPQFMVHSTVYAACMDSAKKLLDEIRNNL